MALAEKLHHTSPEDCRGRGGGEREEVHGEVPEDSSFPGVLPAVRRGRRRLGGCGLGRSLTLCRRAGWTGTSWSTGSETCPFVQILDAPVPQLGNQVLELLQKIVSSLVEPVQVIEVPKMSMPTRCPRTVLSVPQTAEQLVDVPTIISYSSLQRAVEQTIDILVPQARRRGRGGLQSFRTGQGTPAADVEQIVEIPVPQRRRRRSGGLQSSLPGQGSTAFLEQIVDIPAREGLQGFLPGLGSSSSSRLHGGTDEGIQGVFRTFPRVEKSAEEGPHSGSELGADFTPWTPAAYGVPNVPEPVLEPVVVVEDFDYWVDEFGRFWTRSLACPSRWFLQDTSELVWWEEPG